MFLIPAHWANLCESWVSQGFTVRPCLKQKHMQMLNLFKAVLADTVLHLLKNHALFCLSAFMGLSNYGTPTETLFSEAPLPSS